MASVDCRRMSCQSSTDFVQNHAITHREDENFTLQKIRFKRSCPEYVDIYGSEVNYFSTIVFHQEASTDTHDDRNGTLQFDPVHGQGHHIAMDFATCGVG